MPRSTPLRQPTHPRRRSGGRSAPRSRMALDTPPRRRTRLAQQPADALRDPEPASFGWPDWMMRAALASTMLSISALHHEALIDAVRTLF